MESGESRIFNGLTPLFFLNLMLRFIGLYLECSKIWGDKDLSQGEKSGRKLIGILGVVLDVGDYRII